MTDKSNNLSEQIKIHGEAIQKSMSDISETARQAVANINDAFDEAQRRVNEMRRLANFAEGKPPKGMANQHYGIVHGSENILIGDRVVTDKNWIYHPDGRIWGRCIMRPLQSDSNAN